nr:cyanophycin synthetase [Texcoconibacillus texcoconensis]
MPSRRLNVINLRHQSLLIDDTFNANPQSVKSAVEVLKNVGKNKKKVVVLGSMLELGSYSPIAHEQIGEYLADNQIDMIYTYGHKAKTIAETARKNGFPQEKIFPFTNRTALHKKLKQHFSSNSAFLVKGSHRMSMKETSEFIAHYSTKFSNNSNRHSTPSKKRKRAKKKKASKK